MACSRGGEMIDGVVFSAPKIHFLFYYCPLPLSMIFEKCAYLWLKTFFLKLPVITLFPRHVHRYGSYIKDQSS